MICLRFGEILSIFREENGNKFKLSMVIGLVEALASAMKIPAIMYILIGLLGGKPIGKYIGGSFSHYGHCDCDCCYM